MHFAGNDLKRFSVELKMAVFHGKLCGTVCCPRQRMQTRPRGAKGNHLKPSSQHVPLPPSIALQFLLRISGVALSKQYSGLLKNAGSSRNFCWSFSLVSARTVTCPTLRPSRGSFPYRWRCALATASTSRDSELPRSGSPLPNVPPWPSNPAAVPRSPANGFQTGWFPRPRSSSASNFSSCRGNCWRMKWHPGCTIPGHWTIEGAETSQFENHLRAILGLPLGSTATEGHSAMVNLIAKFRSPGKCWRFAMRIFICTEKNRAKAARSGT